MTMIAISFSIFAAYPWRDFLAPNNLPNSLLLLVGVCTAWLALRTLKSIEDQSKIAHATLVSTFRPKLIVRGMGIALQPQSTKSADYVNKMPWKIKLTIENTGGTTAHIRDNNSLEISWHIPRTDRTQIVKTMQIGQNSIRPGESKLHEFAIGGDNDEGFMFLAQMVTNERESVQYLRCVCLITYTDDLNVQRTTRIDRSYDFKTYKFIPSTDPTLSM